jgi:hypothetical protein
MCPIIDKLISCYKPYGVDMLHQISLSSNASQLKYAMVYKNFNMNADYSEVVETTYTLTERAWAKKFACYLAQDKKQFKKLIRDEKFKKRYTEFSTITAYNDNNVCGRDYDWAKELFETHKCYYCKEGFTKDNKPTLDRKNNYFPHTKANCVVSCEYCITYRSKFDRLITKLRIQLRQYARKMGLPMTLSKKDTELYKDIR